MTTGKDVGKDARKATFVSLMGAEQARDASERFAKAAIRALDPVGPAAEPLIQLVDQILENTRRLAPHR